MSDPAAAQHGQIPSLNGLRALSVMIVVIAHSGYGHVVPGGLGVTIFFFLSGYLITTLLLREYERSGGIGIRNFYLRRLFRLFPPLLLTLAIAYALTGMGLLPGGVALSAFLAQIFYLANYYALFLDPGNTIPEGTYALWSLAVEEHFYIFYPAIMMLLLTSSVRFRTIAIIFGSACVAVLAWRLYLVGLPGFLIERTYIASDTRIDSIIYGCILAVAFNPLSADGRAAATVDRQMSPAEWGVLAAGMLLLLATLLIRGIVFREAARYSLQGLALMPIFYFTIRYASRFPFTTLNNAYVAKLGVYSYGIYLIHSIVIGTLQTNAPWIAERRPILLVFALTFSVAFAAAIDRFVDPYFRSFRHRYRASEHQTQLTATPLRQN